MPGKQHSWFARLSGCLRRALRARSAGEAKAGFIDRGLLIFAHTGEVFQAERLLREAGFAV